VTTSRFEESAFLVLPSQPQEGGALTMELRDWLELGKIQLRSEEGQTMTEYGVLLALIAIVVIAALLLLGPAIYSVFVSVTNQL
jgi:pilus assembly protein Flp/PilA